jgi:predicted AAA+ superfamily ATPase
MFIPRPFYLRQLISVKDKDIVKVITGIRRCGKSVLLFNLYYEYLLGQGVDPDHILSVNLETIANQPLRDAQKLYKWLLERMKAGKHYYVFLDEIQLVKNFEDLVNGLRVDHHCDVYITGSNSKLLSREINTRFRGRSTEIKVYPLSFREYMSAQTVPVQQALDAYLLYGGLPFVTEIEGDHNKITYLEDICSTVVFRDVLDRYRIQNEEVLQAVFDFLCSNIGSYVSAHKIANTLRSNGYHSLTDETVSNYLGYLCEAYLFYKAQRYDIKGRAYLKTQNKYYVTDLGIRNARLNFRQLEITHALENLIYLELLRRGYVVDIGKNRDKEIDFVARFAGETYYIQVAYTIADPEKRAQELGAFKGLDDGYKKIVITMDQDPYAVLENGYKKVKLEDFLLDDQILEKM